MSTDPTIREQSYVYFLQEAPELLQVLEQGLQSLHEDSSITKIHTLMRATHTLKGAAASVGLETIKTVAHSLEDIFIALYKPDISINPEIEALLFEGYECLRTPLIAEITGTPTNDSQVLDQAAAIFTRLQEKLGDCFGQEAYIPTSLELGFDMTQSIFEVGVTQRLEELASVMANGQPQAIASTLQTQAEVFLGLAQSLNLPGFEAIAETALAALAKDPDNSANIAFAALADFQQGQAAVLSGDRTQGGQPIALQQLAGGAEEGRLGHNLSASVPVVETESFLEALWSTPDEDAPIHEEEVLWSTTSVEEQPTEPIRVAIEDQTPLPTVDLAETGSSLESIWSTPDEDEPIHEEEVLWSTTSVEEQPTEPIRVAIEDQTQSPIEHNDAIAPVLSVPATNPPQEELSLNNWNKLEVTIETPPSSQRLVETPTRTPKKDSVPRAQTARVNVEHLEHLNYLIGELLTNQNRQSLQDEEVQSAIQGLLSHLQQHQQILSELQNRSDRMLVQPHRIDEAKEKHSSEFDPLELDRHSDLHVLVQSLFENTAKLEAATDIIDVFSRQSSQIVEKQARLLSSARDDLFSIRMMPLGDILNRLPNVLQQLETLYSKRVSLNLSGTEVLVDKAVAEKLYDPLLHVVRNAFDHGIESMEVRQQQGKAQIGKIDIRAFHQGSHLMIEVRDDGQGLKFDRIQQRAVALNLVSKEEALNLNEAQLIDLLFEPGFSTAEQVSNVSGRGVGLDLVRAHLQALQGSVTVYSEPHRGTTFLLQVPFSLTMAKLLLCQTGSTVYALLTDAIEQIVIPHSDQIRHREEGKVLRWGKGADEKLIPVCKLSSILPYSSPLKPHIDHETDSASSDGMLRVILLRCQDELLGLEVDQIIGEQELVIRPLGPMIAPPRYVYGGTILAAGQLSLVIDGSALAKYLLEQQRHDSANNALVSFTPPLLSANSLRSNSDLRYLPAQPDQLKLAEGMPAETILVVDDSITLRQTLALTLQKFGYQVFQARDGYDAVEQLQLQPTIRLVLCDIEMPRMNGFEFLNYRRQIPTIAAIPVVILTSRSGDKHRLMAMELGATAYLNKPYLEQQLLATVAGLLQKSTLSVL